MAKGETIFDEHAYNKHYRKKDIDARSKDQALWFASQYGKKDILGTTQVMTEYNKRNLAISRVKKFLYATTLLWTVGTLAYEGSQYNSRQKSGLETQVNNINTTVKTINELEIHKETLESAGYSIPTNIEEIKTSLKAQKDSIMATPLYKTEEGELMKEGAKRAAYPGLGLLGFLTTYVTMNWSLHASRKRRNRKLADIQ